MNTLTKFVAGLTLCALAASGSMGCNTVRGVGKDIEKGGQNIQDSTKNTTQNAQPTKMHTISASASVGGSMTPSGTVSVPHNAEQSFVATADTGYNVSDIWVDQKSVGAVLDLFNDNSSSYTFLNVTASHVIASEFVQNGKS